MRCRPSVPSRDPLRGQSKLAVIAEIKRRSPSKGDLFADLDPATVAQAYERGGASCLSVLTDEPHFGGSVADLQAARAARAALPVLRKDFTVSERDVLDARIMGADCVLLIAASLDKSELATFHELATSIGLDVLVEIHDEAELDLALAVNASIIGVNQRDLVTFRVDHERAVRMAALDPVRCRPCRRERRTRSHRRAEPAAMPATTPCWSASHWSPLPIRSAAIAELRVA